MSEITKLYENAKITLKKCSECDNNMDCGFGKDCYPPFTAEKQIELIKFLLKNYEGIDISKRINRFHFLVDNATFTGCCYDDKSFEESLAGVINKLWISIPEEEKQQVKGILEWVNIL